MNAHRIGGMRMLSEMVRPQAVEFLDSMFGRSGDNLRFDDVMVPKGSRMVGQCLWQALIQEETNLLVVAVRNADREYIYNPASSFELRAGVRPIVLGEAGDIAKLKKLIAV
ncbi:MAG: hypothetical protein HRU17_06645 [Polyangiaceae bacterium]|nr:hypothetical protein [Polyangiaceae bacterium]